MTTLITSDDAVRSGKQVDDFGFAFVTPLGTYDNGDGHERSPFGT
jgi:hypothetical protein